MKLVKVTWLDTNETSDSGWVSLQEAKDNKPCKVASVGWLVSETEEHITIAGDIDANEIESERDDLLGRTQCFPRGCIIKIQTLYEGLDI
tara:strand:- start:646 stop:915 length:270 start_codon:yes stop_codon:yes gene_type:complete